MGRSGTRSTAFPAAASASVASCRPRRRSAGRRPATTPAAPRGRRWRVVVVGSTVGPSLDTGIYVGDDDTVTVRHNSVTNYVVGVVAENSVNAVVEDNTLRGNTAGVYAIALPWR